MLSWANPIIPHPSNTAEETIIINQLNQLLKNYDNPKQKFTDTRERYEFNRAILEEIIEACEKYITAIPPEKRERKNESDMEWSSRLSVQHPNLLRILEIEKQAVSLGYLPEAETDAKARWQLLKEIFNLNSVPGKPLDEEYWGEFKFNGEMAIVNWLMESNYESTNVKLSFYETVEKDQKRIGIGKQAIKYFERPEDYEVTFDNNGKMYFDGSLLDTKHGSGTNIKRGECLFVAGKDGKIYTNDPDESVFSDTHHSSFIQGKPVMCAGTLRVSQGQITEITVLSGHYKPRREELLNFLNHLSMHCHVDLSKVTVIDQPDGLPKNALKYLQLKGNCLPEEPSDIFYDLAVKAFREKNWDICEKYLDQAITLGNKQALCEKASLLLGDKRVYSSIPENEKEALAKNILNDLSLSPPRQIALTARQLLFQYFNINLYSIPLAPEQPKINIIEKFSSLVDSLKKLELDTESSPKKAIMEEIYNLVSNQKRIGELYSLFALIKKHDMNSSSKERKIFDEQDSILLILQEKVFELAKRDKIGITPKEEKQLREMWREPVNDKKMSLGLFKPESFEKQFDNLVKNEQIKLISSSVPIKKDHH